MAEPLVVQSPKKSRWTTPARLLALVLGVAPALMALFLILNKTDVHAAITQVHTRLSSLLY